MPRDWIQTITGRKFFPLNPGPNDVCIEDIAHALSLQNRFTGHTVRPYSVAEHCIHVSHLVPHEWALVALLHDASEAYLTDVARPVKNAPGFEFYREAERKVQDAVYTHFGLPKESDLNPAIVLADNQMLAAEVEDLLEDPPEPWGLATLRVGGKDENWRPGTIGSFSDWKKVKEAFVNRFALLH